MKKKVVFIAILSIFLLTAVILGIDQNSSPSYLRIIDMNWSISLPVNCKEIYQIDSGADFHGDGQRYHVFKYDTDITQNDLLPEQRISKNDKKRISDILSALKVKNEFYPDFSTITHEITQKHIDNSHLYLCYSKTLRVLYVIEDFY